MKVRKNKEFKYRYIASERNLKQIDKIMTESSELPFSYKVYSVDGSYREFESINNLIDWENSKDKKCRQITIEHNGYKGLRMEIKLGNSALEYIIHGDEKEVDHFSKRIESVFVNMKQWYSIGSTLLSNLILGIIVGIISIIFVSVTITLLNIENDNLIPAVFFIVMVMVFAVLDKVKHNIFPIAQFEIGDGVEEVKRKKYLRSTTIILFLGGILSFIVNQIS